MTVDLVDLPYRDRQRIVVVSDSFIRPRGSLRDRYPAVQKVSETALALRHSADLARNTNAGDGEPLHSVRVAASRTAEWIRSSPKRIQSGVNSGAKRAVDRLMKSGFQILLIGDSEASGVRFVGGPLLRRTVYVGHPYDPAIYYPMAEFHPRLLQDKFYEGFRLLASLGATHIEARRESSAEAALSAEQEVDVPPIPGTDLGAAMNRDVKLQVQRTGSHAWRYELPENPCRDNPIVPERLRWAHEDEWQTAISQRMQHGLREYEIQISQLSELGITASSAAKVAKARLSVGGKFEARREVTWRLHAVFGS